MKKRLRYNNKSSSRIPAVADASRRHLTARSGLEVMLYELLQHALVQKERRNDLPELTPQRARELYEAYRRGEMADVQLMWDQLEERDETLFTVLHARLGALAEMPWAVNIDADLSEDKQALAEQQQELANELLAAVENLPEALTHLGMADFRGVAALEIVGDLRSTIDDLRFANNGEPTLAGESEANGTATARASGAAIPQPEAAERSNRQSTIVNRQSPLRWEVIEPWNLCRPVRRGPWYYNAEATSTPTRPEELDPAAVIIREAQPIDLPAMFLICAKYLSVHAWDAFLEVFGIPNIFLEMPPATPQDKALEFDAIVQRLIGEGRGTVPSGAKFHTVETSKDNTQSFEARAKWCNEAIIQLATGGLLTVTTQSGSGTLAGNAHSDSFSRLCAASARSISAAVNRQFLRPALQAAFPHSPMLVSFELAPEPVDDRLQVAQLLGAVNSAGFRPSAETVSELMNFEVQPIQQAPTGANSAPVANTCNQYSHDPGCPDAQADAQPDKPDSLPDDADDELREAFADADSMAYSGYTREQIWDATGIDYGPTPNGDSPTAADTIRRARAHERTAEKPHSATARFAHRRAAAHKQALQDAEITNSASDSACLGEAEGRRREPNSTLRPSEFACHGVASERSETRRRVPRTSVEPPLNDGELAALRALGGELNPAQIAADAEYMAGEMLAGLREPVANRGDGETEESVLLFESLEIRKAAPLTNCNQHGHDADCPGPTAAGAPEKEAALAKVRDTEDGQTMGRIFDALAERKHGEAPNKEYIRQAPMSKRTADEIEKQIQALPHEVAEKQLKGQNLSATRHAVSADRVQHALKEHPYLKKEDLQLCPDIRENWDSMKVEPRTNHEGVCVEYKKQYGGDTYILVDQLKSSRHGDISFFKSEYIQGESNQ